MYQLSIDFGILGVALFHLQASNPSSLQGQIGIQNPSPFTFQNWNSNLFTLPSQQLGPWSRPVVEKTFHAKEGKSEGTFNNEQKFFSREEFCQ